MNYLVAVLPDRTHKGTEELSRQATRVLHQFEPETIQGYAEPSETKVM